MAATATRAKAGTKASTRATTPRVRTAASPSDAGKRRASGKGKVADAATATAAPSAMPTNTQSGYDAAPEVSIPGGGGATPIPGQESASTRTVHMGRTRKPLAARSAKGIADVLRLAGDSTRVRIVWSLRATGEMNVSTMCKAFGLAQPAVSHHLSLLRHSGIVEAQRQGKASVYSLTAKGELLAEVMAGVEASG